MSVQPAPLEPANPAAPEPQTPATPCTPEPSRKLPPSARDFEIYEAVQIAGCSTYSQAKKHQISQTRVRQIVRRVVEWLGEVLPPQAKVAREQETHLARQIAADRFQHQYQQMTTFWDMTRESKYAGIRLRITTAQARLGAVGGLLDGLAADAIEGIPVPAWQPNVQREGEAPAEPPDGRGSPDSSARPPIDPGEARFLNNFRNIWPRTERVRLAVELEQALELLDPEHREAIRTSEAQRLSPEQLALEAAVRAGRISGDDACRIDPASYSPPNEDCSTKIESPNAEPESVAENHNTSSSYDYTIDTQSDPIAPSDPLLTPREPQPVTALSITPAQPGATVSPASNTILAPSDPSAVPLPLIPEPSRIAVV